MTTPSKGSKGYLCECDGPTHPISCSEAEWESLDDHRPSAQFYIIDKRCPNLKGSHFTTVRTSKNLLLCRKYD